jgi:hypothetical protein
MAVGSSMLRTSSPSAAHADVVPETVRAEIDDFLACLWAGSAASPAE